ncbi:MAG: PEP-CTERM sorting domain-containing protein, partial [Planctomycetota bacterium]|nr:PEP-CTERM sorting domain-containing protein [Planctomycetota bacterium]
DVKVILAGGSAGSGTSDLTETIKITNTSGAPLDFHFFQYANLHLGGQTVNDSVEIRGGNTAVQTCGSTIVSETADVPTPSRYEAGLAFNTLNSLTDGSPTSLSNQAGPTGPGDLTWAFQWDKTIAAGGSLLISKDMHVVPEPATLGLLVLGGLTVIARRRR